MSAGYVVRGRVEDETHAPVSEASVTAEWEGYGRAHADTDAQGKFEVRGLPLVHVRLTVRGAEGVDARAKPTAPDVVLVIPRRATLRVVLEDPPARLGKDFRVGVGFGALPGETFTTFTSLDEKGVAEFEGLTASGRYRLALGPTEDDTVAYREDVRPADGEVRVRLVQGKALTGRILAPEGAKDFDARVDDGPLLWGGDVGSDGRFEVRGVPEGTWIVQVRAQVGDRTLYGVARVATGSPTDIRVRDLGGR
jgi:hypothetical protein